MDSLVATKLLTSILLLAWGCSVLEGNMEEDAPAPPPSGCDIDSQALAKRQANKATSDSSASVSTSTPSNGSPLKTVSQTSMNYQPLYHIPLPQSDLHNHKSYCSVNTEESGLGLETIGMNQDLQENTQSQDFSRESAMPTTVQHVQEAELDYNELDYKLMDPTLDRLENNQVGYDEEKKFK